MKIDLSSYNFERTYQNYSQHLSLENLIKEMHQSLEYLKCTKEKNNNLSHDLLFRILNCQYAIESKIGIDNLHKLNLIVVFK